MSHQRLWGKGQSPDEVILTFTVGNDPVLDARLVVHDVVASKAHVRMLESCGHLAALDSEALCNALTAVGEAFLRGEWKIELEQEDCHTAIEAHLTSRLGSLGGKVHLGRSRNDQVLTALRLYLREASQSLCGRLDEVLASLHALAQTQGDVEIPGYTHMQQAMPSSVRLWAEGHASVLLSNKKLLEAAEHLARECPLGSAAGYGTPGLTLDREFTARELGFDAPQEPVTACQLSRGKAESALAFALSQILGDLGRMAADLCLYATQEFGYVKLDTSISTGSSIMPQKRNPDVFELIRGHASQALADLVAILGLTEKLPSGYHRDLQLLKEPLFRLIDRAGLVMTVAAHALGKLTFDAARANEVTDDSIHAAEEAFALVQSEGISFREAYHRVAAKHKD